MAEQAQRIEALPAFVRELKRLGKKYPSIGKDLEKLGETLLQHPRTGTAIRRGARKVRLAIGSKRKGKSGGARVITYFVEHAGVLYLLYLYDKSELENVSDADLDAWVSHVRDQTAL